MTSWSSRKKEGIFYTVCFVQRSFFNICVLSQFIVYWIHFQNIHTFTHRLHFCGLFLKLSKAFSVSLTLTGSCSMPLVKGKPKQHLNDVKIICESIQPWTVSKFLTLFEKTISTTSDGNFSRMFLASVFL